MYKVLNSSLKSFVPSDSQYLEIVRDFSFHKFIHSGDNLFGEMYEAWVYEYLKYWAINEPLVSNFVIKNPSLKTDSLSGLSYDKNGQIIYVEKGRKLAEYDGLFIYDNKIVFVESSVSELRQYFRKLEDKLIYKRDLLVKLFKTEEVYYLMVTRPKKRSLVYRLLPHLILYKLKNPLFEAITSSTRVFEIDNSKLVDLETISSFYP